MRMGTHRVTRDSWESRFNLRTGLADAVGMGYKGKNSHKKTPHFANPWSGKVLFSGLTEMECTVVWGCPHSVFRCKRTSFKNLQTCCSKVFPIGGVHPHNAIPGACPVVFCGFSHDH